MKYVNLWSQNTNIYFMLLTEVLGAVVSVLIIWIITGVLFYMAVQRCVDQSFDIDADIMMITAGCGFVINIM